MPSRGFKVRRGPDLVRGPLSVCLPVCRSIRPPVIGPHPGFSGGSKRLLRQSVYASPARSATVRRPGLFSGIEILQRFLE